MLYVVDWIDEVGVLCAPYLLQYTCQVTAVLNMKDKMLSLSVLTDVCPLCKVYKLPGRWCRNPLLYKDLSLE